MLFILIENHVFCVPSTTAACKLFNNHRNKKVVGGNYNVLVYYKNASAPGLESVVLCNTFKWDILLFILVKNLVVCVHTTTADCKLFNNHRIKKVVGGNCNVQVNYANASTPNPEGVVLYNTFKWDILLFILIENLVVCVHTTTANCNLFNNHRNKKVVGGNYIVLVHYQNASAPSPEGVVLCNTHKWDILLGVHIHFKISKMCAVCEPRLWDTSWLTRLRNITILHPIGQL